MFRSSFWLFVSKFGVALLNFGTIILLSRWLGPAERGVCAWFLVVIALSLVFSDMIAGPTAGFLMRRFSSRQIVRVSYAWSLVVSFITVFVLLIFKKSTLTEAVLLGMLCWLNAANSLHNHLLLAKENFLWFNRLALLSPLLSFVLLFVARLFVSPDRRIYLFSLLAAWVVAWITGFSVVKKMHETAEIKRVAAVIRNGFANGMSNQLNHLASLLNNRLIYFLLSASLLGTYANALSLAEASLIIPTSLGQVLYARRLNRKTNSLHDLYRNLGLAFLLSGCVTAAVVLIPGETYVFLFGPLFAGVKMHLAWIAFFIMFYSGYLVCSYWQSAQGLFMQNFYASVAGLAVNLAFSGWFWFRGTYSVHMGVLALGASFVAIFLASLLFIRQQKPAVQRRTGHF